MKDTAPGSHPRDHHAHGTYEKISKERLQIARRMYAKRFPGEDVSQLTMQQLCGGEGVRVRRLYAEHSQRTGVPWTRREYRPGDVFAAGDDINRLLSAANAAHGCHLPRGGQWSLPLGISGSAMRRVSSC
ncbi:hypothetical protein SNE510_74070 [Streptomyces sp. NE5-10]|nr:hypothetical protein SNE510_74070 [Streptomyces sp. NE5-10]